MRTIDIGIGHDDNLVVTQLLIVGLLAVFAQTEAHTQRLYDVVHLFVLEGFVPHHALHIEDLTADRQYSLELTLTTLLGRTACRVTLDDEEFAVGCIVIGAVSQFAGQTTTAHGALALYTLASLACCHTCCSRQYHLIHNELGLMGMLLQIG